MQKLTMLGKSYSTPLPQGNTIRITLTPKDVMYFQCTLEYKTPFPLPKTQLSPIKLEDFHALYQNVFLNNIFEDTTPVTLEEQLFHMLGTRGMVEYGKLWSSSIRKSLLETLQDATPEEIRDRLYDIFDPENLNKILQQQQVAWDLITHGQDGTTAVLISKLKAIVALSDFTLVHNPELPEEVVFTYSLVD